jgi:AAA+ ATPase superfamily predicted ATPase
MSDVVLVTISLSIGLTSVIYGCLHNFTIYGLIIRTFIVFVGSFIILKISFYMLKIVLKVEETNPKPVFKPLQIKEIKRNTDLVTETVKKI